ERIVYSSIADLPAAAINERRILDRQGLRSFAIVPMGLERRLFGTLGCSTISHERHWPDEAISLLQIAGEIFVGAIERNRTYHARRGSQARHRLICERTIDMVSRTARRGRFLYVSDAARSLVCISPDVMVGGSIFACGLQEDHPLLRHVGLFDGPHTF